MERVPLDEKFYLSYGALMLIVGVIVVLVIFPILDIVENNRENMQDNDRIHGLNNWDQERETGFLLLATAMTVGQVMVFIGLIMMAIGRIKESMVRRLSSMAVQCENCQIWFDRKWPRCPKCDKNVMETPYSDKSKPHAIEVAIPVNADRRR